MTMYFSWQQLWLVQGGDWRKHCHKITLTERIRELKQIREHGVLIGWSLKRYFRILGNIRENWLTGIKKGEYILSSVRGVEFSKLDDMTINNDNRGAKGITEINHKVFFDLKRWIIRKFWSNICCICMEEFCKNKIVCSFIRKLLRDKFHRSMVQ